MGWHNGWGMMMGGGWFMWLSILILVGAVVWAFVYMSNSRGGSNSGGPHPEQRTALELLQERYARGEITREEYEQLRNDLV